MKAGRKCGDLVHPLVYCPELHFSEFTSAVADMKNSVAVGVGPACTNGRPLYSRGEYVSKTAVLENQGQLRCLVSLCSGHSH